VTAAFVRGFKASAERLAAEVRIELDLSATDPLDPQQLADHLGIPVLSLAQLEQSGAARASLQHFLGRAASELSALTVCRGSAKLIVVNPRHAATRRSSSLAHELSHVLLEHEPGPVLGFGGCRRWSQQHENEADWLAGVLLVPRAAALEILRSGRSLSDACELMGVSAALMRWRVNSSGAKLQWERTQGDSRRKR
jgi:Zn-dependent peptidase ImmA (M78 family)